MTPPIRSALLILHMHFTGGFWQFILGVLSVAYLLLTGQKSRMREALEEADLTPPSRWGLRWLSVALAGTLYGSLLHAANQGHQIALLLGLLAVLPLLVALQMRTVALLGSLVPVGYLVALGVLLEGERPLWFTLALFVPMVVFSLLHAHGKEPGRALVLGTVANLATFLVVLLVP